MCTLGFSPATWHPLPPWARLRGEVAENWGPSEVTYTPGLEGSLPQFCLPLGATHYSSWAHSLISRHLKNLPQHTLWGRENRGATLGGGRPAQGCQGETAIRADREKRPGDRLDCSASSLTGPTQRASLNPRTRPRSWHSAGVRARRGHTEPAWVWGTH